MYRTLSPPKTAGHTPFSPHTLTAMGNRTLRPLCRTYPPGKLWSCRRASQNPSPTPRALSGSFPVPTAVRSLKECRLYVSSGALGMGTMCCLALVALKWNVLTTIVCVGRLEQGLIKLGHWRFVARCSRRWWQGRWKEGTCTNATSSTTTTTTTATAFLLRAVSGRRWHCARRARWRWCGGFFCNEGNINLICLQHKHNPCCIPYLQQGFRNGVDCSRMCWMYGCRSLCTFSFLRCSFSRSCWAN